MLRRGNRCELTPDARVVSLTALRAECRGLLVEASVGTTSDQLELAASYDDLYESRAQDHCRGGVTAWTSESAASALQARSPVVQVVWIDSGWECHVGDATPSDYLGGCPVVNAARENPALLGAWAEVAAPWVRPMPAWSAEI